MHRAELFHVHAPGRTLVVAVHWTRYQSCKAAGGETEIDAGKISRRGDTAVMLSLDPVDAVAQQAAMLHHARLIGAESGSEPLHLSWTTQCKATCSLKDDHSKWFQNR